MSNGLLLYYSINPVSIIKDIIIETFFYICITFIYLLLLIATLYQDINNDTSVSLK